MILCHRSEGLIMSHLNLVLFIYLSGVLVSFGLLVTLDSYGLLTENNNTEVTLGVKILASLFSWLPVISFVIGIIIGFIHYLRNR